MSKSRPPRYSRWIERLRAVRNARGISRGALAREAGRKRSRIASDPLLRELRAEASRALAGGLAE